MLTDRHRYAATGLNTLLGEHFEPQVMHMPKILQFYACAKISIPLCGNASAVMTDLFQTSGYHSADSGFFQTTDAS